MFVFKSLLVKPCSLAVFRHPGHCLLSPRGAVLAVTIVHSKKSTEAKQRVRLEKVLVTGAELHKESHQVPEIS